MKNSFSIPFVAIVLLTLLVFGIIHWTNLPFSFLDWVIGVTLFWWLLLITTVPWNLHFKAKEVISDGKDSKEANMEVREKDMAYARKISRTYLIVAIFLHLFSFVGFYYLAESGVSVVGYYGAGAALLLTALRPAVRLYEYINYRLRQMKQRIHYPREDVLLLTDKVYNLEAQYEGMHVELKQATENRQELEQKVQGLKHRLQQWYDEMLNKQQHLVKETEQKMSTLSEDAAFLNQVRQLLRFIKEA
ncbi:MAG: hypothetical protein AAF598_14510 [Bacteroidota bacterium]